MTVNENESKNNDITKHELNVDVHFESSSNSTFKDAQKISLFEAGVMTIPRK